jgi:hypothetical protein
MREHMHQDVVASVSAIIEASPWSRVFVLYCTECVYVQAQQLQRLVRMSSGSMASVTLVPVASSCFHGGGGSGSSSQFRCAVAFTAHWQSWLHFKASAAAAVVLPPSTLVTRPDVLRFCSKFLRNLCLMRL